jgi:hypothetical protein
MHANSFDMNVLYDGKRAKQAKEIQELEKAKRAELERRRLIRENRAKFNHDIRKGEYEGRLNLM